jgi:hypothetical protein
MTRCFVLVAWLSCWLSPLTAETPPGFKPLVVGSTLAGWRGGTTHDPRTATAGQQAGWDAEVAAHWQAVDGVLISDGHEPHLVTSRVYDDFELMVDWMIQPRGDSGVYLRGAPQVQLWDPANIDAHQHGSDKGSGGLWNNDRNPRFPTVRADRPCGEWNTMRVQMVGPFVTVVLNNTKVADNVVMDNYFDRSLPIFRSGPVHLQTHGSETRFRNVAVREIPDEESNALLAEIAGGDDGFTPLFDGTSLVGWTGAVDDYEVVGDALRCKSGRGGALLSEEEYGDFVLRFEFKLPAGGNNGLAIRTPRGSLDPAYEGIELQILDNTAPQYSDLHDYQFHGSAYGLAPALRGYLRPVGQWNFQEVTVNGDRVQVTLNGYSILDTDLAEARRSPADGKPHPGAANARGCVGFCGHNDPVMIRNVRIHPLRSDATADTFAD